MTGNPLLNRSTVFDEFLEKLVVEEKDNSVLREKVDFMSNVAVDKLFAQAEGHIISLKGPALLALAAHKDPRCETLIKEFLEDQSQILKSFAIRAVQVFHSQELAKELCILLKDPSSMIRLKAMEAIAKINFEILIPYLFELSEDPVWFVREKLIEISATHHEAERTLLFLCHDQNKSVKELAEKTLKNILDIETDTSISYQG